MSLELDPRQRAMLAEMGVRLFWPEPVLVAAEAPAPAPVVRPPAPPPLVVRAPAPAPVPLPVRAPAPTPVRPLAAAVSEPAAAPAAADLFGAGDPQPDWLLLVDPASEAEQRAGEPVAGEAGKLLDNMLQALAVSRRRGAYIACVPGEAGESQLPLLRRAVERLRPRVILAMGRFAVKGLLESSEPPGRLRGRPHDFFGVPVVVTYPPATLLQYPAEKAKAWADLCLALSLLR